MGKEFIWQVRVYYEDTDAGGVIFYANYLRFMERARTEWLRNIGFEHKQLIDKYKLLFAVKNLTIDYINPGYLDNLLTITSKLLDSRVEQAFRFNKILKMRTINCLVKQKLNLFAYTQRH